MSRVVEGPKRAERTGGAAPLAAPPAVLAASRPAAAPGRWTAAVFLTLVLVPIAFNAVTLWPEASVPVPNLNDDATHYLLIERASEALATGENPIDHWVPELELGFPWFLYYQHLPHFVVIGLHRLLLGRVGLFTLFNLVRYVLLLGSPLAVYWSMRRMAFSVVAAGTAAAPRSPLPPTPPLPSPSPPSPAPPP